MPGYFLKLFSRSEGPNTTRTSLKQDDWQTCPYIILHWVYKLLMSIWRIDSL